MEGQIIKIKSNTHDVFSDGKVYSCIPRGKFRKDKILPRVGDYVIFDQEKLVITEILKRKNSFTRPLVSNIDQAFLITSLKDPDFSLNLLDRFLTLMELHNVKSIICLTKTDLISKEEYKSIRKTLEYYQKLGYDILTNLDIEELKAIIKDKTNVFVGQTGAGKSTLLNKLNPSWNLLTGEISKALGRGRHTTRNVELYLFLNGKVLDTPGFSALNFNDYSKEEIKKAFPEFQKYSCPFKDCSHTKEQECEIRKKVASKEILETRYNNYLKFYEEAK